MKSISKRIRHRRRPDVIKTLEAVFGGKVRIIEADGYTYLWLNFIFRTLVFDADGRFIVCGTTSRRETPEVRAKQRAKVDEFVARAYRALYPDSPLAALPERPQRRLRISRAA